MTAKFADHLPFNLSPHMITLQNVIKGLISLRKVPSDEAVERGQGLLALVGLSEKTATPAKLSGGQKRCVAIARGLAMDPEIIFFDEPTSALDLEQREEVLSVMLELANAGMTMLAVTHKLRFAREAADRIVFVKKGVIVKDCVTDEFFGNGSGEMIQQFLHRY